MRIGFWGPLYYKYSKEPHAGDWLLLLYVSDLTGNRDDFHQGLYTKSELDLLHSLCI